jgi:hypothetical protein
MTQPVPNRHPWLIGTFARRPGGRLLVYDKVPRKTKYLRNASNMGVCLRQMPRYVFGWVDYSFWNYVEPVTPQPMC